MSDFHGRILNLQIDVEKQVGVRDVAANFGEVYKIGHRDARHAAAELALEADRRTEAAKAVLAAVESWMAGESGPLFTLWENAEIGSYEYEQGGDITWPETLANIRDLNCPEEELGCDGAPVEVGIYRQIYGLLSAAKGAR